jgi:hypothetical protein
MRKDATKMGAGSPEYVLFFRKAQSDLSRGYADDPVDQVGSTTTASPAGRSTPRPTGAPAATGF